MTQYSTGCTTNKRIPQSDDRYALSRFVRGVTPLHCCEQDAEGCRRNVPPGLANQGNHCQNDPEGKEVVPESLRRVPPGTSVPHPVSLTTVTPSIKLAWASSSIENLPPVPADVRSGPEPTRRSRTHSSAAIRAVSPAPHRCGVHGDVATCLLTEPSRSPIGWGHQVSWGRANLRCTRPYDLAMFMVTLTYLVDLSEVDAALPEHVAWLDQQYADGVFVASGRQVPRVGGMILVAGTSREDLERRLALYPFGRLGLADHAVVEFFPSRVADGLEQLLQ